MKISETKIAEWFLRISLSAGFLSAVADRFGVWSKDVSVWGNWGNFIAYTKTLNPYFPDGFIPVLGYGATGLEIIFGILLLINFKTVWIARGSALLLLVFGLSMALSVSIKAPLDYSVFLAAAAAFALSVIIKMKSKK